MTEPDGWSTLLVRYGEIGIKTPAIRLRFERRLMFNVEAAMLRRGVEGEVVRERGRLFVRARDAAGALEALAHTFGVVSASAVVEMPADPDEIARRVAAVARVPAGKSFAVRARRTGEHAFSSVDLARRVGSAVWEATPGARVDLKNPDVELLVEVREDRAYFYRDVVPGPGGLPVGTQGKVVIVLDSPRAALAAWLMMKRGCTPLLLVDEAATRDARIASAARALRAWSPPLRATSVVVPEPFAATRAGRRAFLLKAAGSLARSRRAQAVVLGDGLAGALATAPLDALSGKPVFRPLTGFEGGALEALARSTEMPFPGPDPAFEDAAPVDVPIEAVRAAMRAHATWEAAA